MIDPRLVDPGLLEVVPWSYGYAHSWAFAALLTDPRTRGAILGRLAPQAPEPVQLEGPVLREKGLKPARADLAFQLRDSAGELHAVAVETKVNDPFKSEQMVAYREAGHVPLLFLPGPTGMLLQPTPLTNATEIRFFGSDLLAAIEPLGLAYGPILAGYLDALRAETTRMQTALSAARDGAVADLGPGRVAAEHLADVAWLAETYRALPAACEGTEVSPGGSMRIEANDRGIFFEDSFACVTDGGGLWVDVLTDVRTNARAVAIKAGERRIAEAWDLAAAQPAPGAGWRRTSRRVGGGTATVWKRSLDGVSAADAAAEAARAAQFIARLAA